MYPLGLARDSGVAGVIGVETSGGKETEAWNRDHLLKRLDYQ